MCLARKLRITGKDSAYVIDRCTTHNDEKIASGRAAYAAMLNPEGKFIDDCVICHIAVTLLSQARRVYFAM